MYLLGMSLYALLCRHLLFFYPAVPRTASGEGEMYSLPPCFTLIPTFCYYSYGFLRELDLAFGTSPDRDEAHPFHGQTRLAKLNDFATDIHDAMELWALGPHVILVKVISACGLHVFFHQYVADLREWKSENILRTVSASPLLFDMTVMSTSGVIAMPPEVPVRKILPLTTVVNIMHSVKRGTPFVVPPAPGIEQPVMQAQEFLTCRPLKSREPLPLFSFSASFTAPTLPRDSAKYSSSSFSLDRIQPLRGNTSPPAGEARLPPPAVWFRVWMIQTLPCGVSCFRGQNPFVLYLNVRQSGLCCRPDPPVLPTGSVFRISTTLPAGSSTSITTRTDRRMVMCDPENLLEHLQGLLNRTSAT